MDRYIKQIYYSIPDGIPINFCITEEKEKYIKFYNIYKKDNSKHLFVDDFENGPLEILTEDEMLEKFKSKKYFDSGMLMANNTEDIKNLKYMDFYIYIEVKSLKYLGETLNTIIEILNKKYSKKV